MTDKDIKEDKDIETPKPQEKDKESKTELKPGQKIIKDKDGKDKIVYENVDANLLDKMASKLDRVEKELERVEYASDKGRLMIFDSRQKGNNYLTVKLRKYKDRYITGWKVVEDIVEQNPETGAWIQKQTSQLFFSDSKKDEKPIIIPTKVLGNFEKESCEVTKDQKDAVTGIRILTVKTKEGIEIKIDVTFIN